MNIFLIQQSGSYAEYSQFAAVGTWSEGDELCPECTACGGDLTPPLLVEWEHRAKSAGDFAWDAGYICVVQRHVRDFLMAEPFECEFSEIKTVGRSDRLVPEEGRNGNLHVDDEYSWLRATRKLELDERQSGVTAATCDHCGRVERTFRRDGIVISVEPEPLCLMFRILQNEPSDATFVTEEGKAMLEAKGFTNLAFAEAGVIQASS